MVPSPRPISAAPDRVMMYCRRGAASLTSWLRVLRADTRALFFAAAHAQRAVDSLHSLQEGAV